MTQSGVNDVAEAVNITIDQYNRPSRRKGFYLLQSGDFHSLYCDGGDCFVASGDAIFRVSMLTSTTIALQGIRSGMTRGSRVAWTQVGDETYYSNGFERGIIKDGVSRVWSVGDYHGPDTNMSFTVPDNITHLETNSGIMFASSGPVLWWSEPFRYDLFNMTEGFVVFNTAVRMIKAVAGGLFIGTGKNTYFLSGLLPSEFQLVKIANFPPVEWSDAIDYVEGLEVGMQIQGLCALWASPEGAILGTPSGQIINLDKDKIIYPENVTHGFGGLMGYHFIHGMG